MECRQLEKMVKGVGLTFAWGVAGDVVVWQVCEGIKTFAAVAEGIK